MEYKAIDIMRTFTKEELADCRDFVNSRYFNKSAKVSKLYEVLEKFYPQFDSKKLSEESLSREVSPHLAYNKSSMKNLFADLGEVLENFIMHVDMKKTVLFGQYHIREQYVIRGLYKHLRKAVNNSEKTYRQKDNCSSFEFLHKSLVTSSTIIDLIKTGTKLKQDYVTTYQGAMKTRIKYLVAHTVVEIIKGLEHFKIHSRNYNLKDGQNTFSKLWEEFDIDSLIETLSKDKDDPILALNFQLYNLMQVCFNNIEDHSRYQEYKKHLLSNTNKIYVETVRFHCIMLVKYCMTKNEMKGFDGKYDDELFSIYKFILEKGYHKSIYVQSFPVEVFRTIILHSLKVDKAEFAESIVRNYSHEIADPRKDNLILWAEAHISFCRNDFSNSLALCQRVVMNHFHLKFEIKNLMLMNFFELGDEVQLKQLTDTYRHFLKNDKLISERERSRNTRFLQAISKLVILKGSKTKDSELFELEKLTEEDMSNKKWIRKKIKEMAS